MIGDSIGEGVQAKKQLKAAKTALKDAKKDRERGVWMAQQMDYNPEYASDHVGPYTKAESPIADAFLSSFLTGDNASGIQGTRKGAARQKAAADARSAQRFGSVDDLIAREREVQAQTPWEVKQFTRRIEKPDVSKETYERRGLEYLTPEQQKALEAQGFKFKDGKFSEKKSKKTAKKLMKNLDFDGNTPEGQKALVNIADQLLGGVDLKDYYKDVTGGKLGTAHDYKRQGMDGKVPGYDYDEIKGNARSRVLYGNSGGR